MEMEPINRPEFDATVARLSDEDKRQNHRLDILEDTVREINDLTTAVEKLAISVESQTKELSNQSKRLESLEGRDGEKWRTTVQYIVTAVVGVIIGVVVAAIGL